LLQHSNLRTTDAYILSEFHPTCLSNEPAPAIKTDYSAPRTGRKRDTWLPLHRTRSAPNNEFPARACGLIFHLDVARAAVASGRFVGGQLKLRRRLYHGSRVRVTA